MFDGVLILLCDITISLNKIKGNRDLNQQSEKSALVILVSTTACLCAFGI